MRRWRCGIAVLWCLIAMTGCAVEPTTSDPISSVPPPAAEQGSIAAFSLAYSKEDTLNPYVAATEANAQLAGLLYDGLTVLDGAFMPQNSLASQIELTDATHLTVTLRTGAKFSDGTAITPADVVTSYQNARAGANYKVLLSNVTGAVADNKKNRIVFTLASPDPQAAACLSFPIVKGSTLTKEVGMAPVGSGHYTVQSDETGVFLVPNPYAAKAPRYKTVRLQHLPNSDAMYYGLTSGSITYYYNDLNAGEIPRVTGSSAAVDMNALLFLGVNENKPALGEAAVRQTVSVLLDRKTLAASVCSGWALPATMPFHPHWGAVAALTGISDTRDLTGAVNLLESAGYGNGQQKLSLELIYCNTNSLRSVLAEQVRTSLESAGIAVTLTPLGFADYKSRIAAGKFDLYIGEIRLAANMDLSPLLSGGGIRRDSPAVTSYGQYRSGEITLADFVRSFNEDLPYIPLCWRSGFAGYDRRLATVNPHGYNVYYGFENWH